MEVVSFLVSYIVGVIFAVIVVSYVALRNERKGIINCGNHQWLLLGAATAAGGWILALIIDMVINMMNGGI